MFGGDPLDLEGFTDANFEIRANVMAYVSGQVEGRQRIPAGKEKEITLVNARWTPFVDWKTGTAIGRQSDEKITVLAELAGSNSRGLASSGIRGIRFASIAGRAYELASARGLGRLLDRQLFLQDIST